MLCHHGTGNLVVVMVVAVSCTHIRTPLAVVMLMWSSPSHASRRRRRCCGLPCCRCRCRHASSSLLSCISIASAVVPIAISVAVAMELAMHHLDTVVVVVSAFPRQHHRPPASGPVIATRIPCSATGPPLTLLLPSATIVIVCVVVVKPCQGRCTAWRSVGAEPHRTDVCG